MLNFNTSETAFPPVYSTNVSIHIYHISFYAFYTYCSHKRTSRRTGLKSRQHSTQWFMVIHSDSQTLLSL